MTIIARSTIATRFGAILALGLAGAVLAGSITPAAAHKGGGGHHQQQPKSPKNPGPIGPLPKPQPMPVPPPVVRDHRSDGSVRGSDHRL